MKNFKNHLTSTILVLILIAVSASSVYSQSGVRDSIIRFPLLGVSYGLFKPGGDLKDRFGTNSMISGEILFKTKKNLLWGISTGFFFGDNVKEPGLLDALSTSDGQIIGLDGLYAEIRIFERGYHAGATFGGIISFKKPNPNSGLVILGGPGFMQHKIRIEDVGNTVPALRGDYKKGYDRLTNGLRLHQYIGYVYFSNRQLVNFYGGFEFIQGFTQGRRDYNFDKSEPDDSKRIDLMYGFKLGWVLPLYKKKPAAFYYF
jgi:hypothetical protein